MPATITTILILATLVEALVEYLVRPLVKPPKDPAAGVAEAPAEEREDPSPTTIPAHTADLVLRYSAAVVGLALCVIYRADLLALLGLTCPVPYAGEAITGLLIGRGANYIHDFANRWLTWPAASRL
jgi:hypothetical protein